MIVVLRKYGETTNIYFELVNQGGTEFLSAGTDFIGTDTEISKNGGTFAATTNQPVHIGNGIYQLTLTENELEASVAVVIIMDTTTSQAWNDQSVTVETYGAADAQHEFDLDTGTQNVKLTTDGLDNVSVVGPKGPATNFREMMVQVWRRFFKKHTLTNTLLTTFADDGETVTTIQEVADDTVTQTVDRAT